LQCGYVVGNKLLNLALTVLETYCDLPIRIVGAAPLRFAAEIEVEKEQRADDRHPDDRHTSAPPDARFHPEDVLGHRTESGNETLAMTRAARVSKAATPYSR